MLLSYLVILQIAKGAIYWQLVCVRLLMTTFKYLPFVNVQSNTMFFLIVSWTFLAVIVNEFFYVDDL